MEQASLWERGQPVWDSIKAYGKGFLRGMAFMFLMSVPLTYFDRVHGLVLPEPLGVWLLAGTVGFQLGKVRQSRLTGEAAKPIQSA